MTKEVLRSRLSGLLFVLLFVIDKTTKEWALSLDQSLTVFTSYISLLIKTTINSFFTFSIQAPFGLVLSVHLCVFLLLVAIWIRGFLKQSAYLPWLAVILAGGAGNLYDRLIYGGVVDWIEFSIGSFHWSSFNLADIFIIIGALGWLYQSSKDKELLST